MDHRGEWIPPNAPLSEEYWQALLRDGEDGRAGAASYDVLWDGEALDTPEEYADTDQSDTIEDVWSEACVLMEEGEVLELPVVGSNRGGLLVGWKDLQGFVPASHLLDLTPSVGEEERQEELGHLIGTRLPLTIIEVDPDGDRLVLSERATQADEGASDVVLSSLEPGEVCEGRVTNLCSFGAFVDLGGFEGLIHISELSWGRVGHPSDMLQVGQSVSVYVLNVEPERERVGLSVKRLRPNPWETVQERYAVGQVVDGIVTHVVDFGAFVQVEDGLEGLVHVSELSSGGARNPHAVVREGDRVAVQVLDVDRARRRMGLRLERSLGPKVSPDGGGQQAEEQSL